MPQAMPITSAPTGPTKPEAGVIATRPATAPEQMPMTVGLPRCAHSTNIQVERRDRGRDLGDGHGHAGLQPAVTAEPALKPNQPTHSRPGR